LQNIICFIGLFCKRDSRRMRLDPSAFTLRKTIGLFCRISSLWHGSFAKETYNVKESTKRSDSIPWMIICYVQDIFILLHTIYTCMLCMHSCLFASFKIPCMNICRVPYVLSCHTYERVMSHMSHGSHMHESCLKYAWVMSMSTSVTYNIYLYCYLTKYMYIVVCNKCAFVTYNNILLHLANVLFTDNIYLYYYIQYMLSCSFKVSWMTKYVYMIEEQVYTYSIYVLLYVTNVHLLHASCVCAVRRCIHLSTK